MHIIMRNLTFYRGFHSPVLTLVCLYATWFDTPNTREINTRCALSEHKYSCMQRDMILPTPSRLPPSAPCPNTNIPICNVIWHPQHQVNYHLVCPVLTLLFLYTTWHDTSNTRYITTWCALFEHCYFCMQRYMTLPTPGKLPPGAPCSSTIIPVHNVIWHSPHTVNYHLVWPVLTLVFLYTMWYNTHSTR